MSYMGYFGEGVNLRLQVTKQVRNIRILSAEWSSKRANTTYNWINISTSLGLIFIFIFFHSHILPILFNMSYFIIVTMAALRVLACLTIALTKTTPHPTYLQEYPHLTILAPLYNEAHMVEKLMQHLSQLEYPREKLQIIIVCEADDLQTCAAVRARLHAPFSLFETPPSLPRTKPKALNAALAHIAQKSPDEIVTIYDAEDRPHPLQLKTAACALAHDPDLAVVQAPLGFYNAPKNLLTAFFSLEYAALFHIINPAFCALKLPFTLGGTSNHIRRSILSAIGGWDSYNVTEDADLSFRIASLRDTKHPSKIGCIPHGTQEEAIDNVPMWTHQRSRWLKGFMQTANVHTRKHDMGPTGEDMSFLTRVKNLVALNLTIGATLFFAYLHVPSIVLLCTAFLLEYFGFKSVAPLPPLFLPVLVFGYSAAILTSILGVLKENKPFLIFFAPLLPLYWLLQFPAVLIASYEFIVAPSHWRKTKHVGQDYEIPNNATDIEILPLEQPQFPPI
ncbi:MAG: hypothetical protein COA43_02215 [Robiginitomaculum sp.]|nr:MAG: hypothetical protein COA43_02215 [Robiginitomaculum sp.]